MMGIPDQTIESYHKSLEKALGLGFGHLSFYMLTLEKNTPFEKIYSYDKKPLPQSDIVADMFDLTNDMLSLAGYDHYEISNYGKIGCESRHNLMYWTGDKPYLAFGCGAASYLDNVRFTRPKTLK